MVGEAWLSIAGAVIAALIVSMATGGFAWLWKRGVDGQFDAMRDDIREIKSEVKRLPEQFSQVHARVSDTQKDVVRLDTKLDAHIDESRYGRSGE